MNEQNMTLIERKSLRQRVSGSVWRMAYRAKRTIARKFRRIEYYLKGLAPCWTEFHAYNDDGDEILNDFDLSKFNKLITF